MTAGRATSGLRGRRWRGLMLGLAATLLAVAAFAFRDELVLAALDPKVPFQTYDPPPAPDYSEPRAWALWNAAAPGGRSDVDVFFIHPTTYDGGEEWVGPIDHRRSRRRLREVMIPNYAGPFQRVGRVFAPLYRQASLYAMQSQREDAREARAFAYGDVERAFDRFVAATPGRPFILVGVEQGGSLGARLLAERIATDGPLRSRLVTAYLLGVAVPADNLAAAGLAACARPDQRGCVVAYQQVWAGEEGHGRRLLRRALAWTPAGELAPLGKRDPICVNPLLGTADGRPAAKSRNLGAVNATNLEWGLRPAFLPHQAGARCEGGLLRVTRPESRNLRPARGLTERLKAPQYNLFYADLEADALRRLGRP